MKTILKDRVLWYDGSITFTPDQLTDFVLNGGQITPGIYVDALNSEIESFNRLNPSLILNVKRDLDHLDQTWNIPKKYKDINIRNYVHKQLLDETEKRLKADKPFNDDEVNIRLDRIEEELELYESYDMNIIIKTIIYIVDTFKENEIIWGTGRGSSCSSYILYLIGLHNVDSVFYELDLKEFFK